MDEDDQIEPVSDFRIFAGLAASCAFVGLFGWGLVHIVWRGGDILMHTPLTDEQLSKQQIHEIFYVKPFDADASKVLQRLVELNKTSTAVAESLTKIKQTLVDNDLNRVILKSTDDLNQTPFTLHHYFGDAPKTDLVMRISSNQTNFDWQIANNTEYFHTSIRAVEVSSLLQTLTPEYLQASQQANDILMDYSMLSNIQGYAANTPNPFLSDNQLTAVANAAASIDTMTNWHNDAAAYATDMLVGETSLQPFNSSLDYIQNLHRLPEITVIDSR